jgi:hypothetical protein
MQYFAVDVFLILCDCVAIIHYCKTLYLVCALAVSVVALNIALD